MKLLLKICILLIILIQVGCYDYKNVNGYIVTKDKDNKVYFKNADIEIDEDMVWGSDIIKIYEYENNTDKVTKVYKRNLKELWIVPISKEEK